MDITIWVILYWIAGILGLIYAIILLFAVLDIRAYLKEMLIKNRRRRKTEASQVFSESDKNDSEVRDLVNKLKS